MTGFWANFSPTSQNGNTTKYFEALALVLCLTNDALHSRGLITFPENPTMSPFHGKNGDTGTAFWADFSSMARPKKITSSL